MCRLLGAVASRLYPLPELLAGDLAPFVDLACEHRDGWGISYIDSADRVVTAKELGRADQSSHFKRLAGRIVTDAAMIHLRLASDRSAVTVANTHPFGDAKGVFAHNGYFARDDSLDSKLIPGPIAAVGDTDSERFYLAIRHRIDNGIAPTDAIAMVSADIRAFAAKYVSLNCLFLSSEAMYAYADHDPNSEVIRRRGPRFFDLSYRVEPGRIVVASAGWPQPADRWTRLPERHLLEVRRDDLRTIIHED